jgi:hypothetical protein
MGMDTDQFAALIEALVQCHDGESSRAINWSPSVAALLVRFKDSEVMTVTIRKTRIAWSENGDKK